MLNRIVSGTVATLALLTVIAFDARLADTAHAGSFAPQLVRYGSVIPIAMTAVILIAASELIGLVKRAGMRPCAWWAMVMCAALMLSPWLSAGRLLGDSPTDVEGQHWQLTWIMVSVVGALTIHLRRGVSQTVVGDTASTVFVIMYLGLLPSFAIALRASTTVGDPIAGAWMLLIVLLIVFASDIGALYVGRALGRHKLAPVISPAKTIAGAVGGVLGSVAVAMGIWELSWVVEPDGVPQTFSDQCRLVANQVTSGTVSMTMLQMIFFGFTLSIASQISDLVESQIKRCAKVKDSARSIPGMGGVLDVIDGTIIAVPIAWILLTRVWKLM